MSTVSVQSNRLWPSHMPVDEYATPGLLCRLPVHVDQVAPRQSGCIDAARFHGTHLCLVNLFLHYSVTIILTFIIIIIQTTPCSLLDSIRTVGWPQ